jgi:hypothetical protein
VLSLGNLPTLLNVPVLAVAVIDNVSLLKKLVGETFAARKRTILPLIAAYTNKSLFERMVTEKQLP